MRTIINERKCASRSKMTLMMWMQLIEYIPSRFDQVRQTSRPRPRDIRHFSAFSIVYFQYLSPINLLFALLHLLSCLVYVSTHVCGPFDLHSRRTSSLEIISSVWLSFLYTSPLYHVTSMTPGINLVDENEAMYIDRRAFDDRKLTKNTTSEKERMNVLEFVSITCQAVNPSASMDCFRLSLELHPAHISLDLCLCKKEMIGKLVKCSRHHRRSVQYRLWTMRRERECV